MKHVVLMTVALLFVPAGWAQVPDPQIPDSFPQFLISGRDRRADCEDVGKAMRELFWHHYPPAGPMSTFEDGWLVAPSLWPNTDKAETNRNRWKNAFLSRKIDADGYVTTLQHHGYAHADGWPFPLYSQGGTGWVFTHVHGAFYDEQYGVQLTKSLDGFELQGMNEAGIDEQAGLTLQITGDYATLTSPPCSIDTETIALLRWDWDVSDDGTISLEWTTDDEPE